MKLDRRLITVAIGLAALLAVALPLALRGLSPVRLLEMKLYDAATAERAAPVDDDSPVVQIVFTEKFLNGATIAGEHWPHPIPDERLAQILARLIEGGAEVVGVDIWRGIPQPRGNDDETLDQLLEGDDGVRILWIHDPDSDSDIKAAPAGLAEDTSRAVLAEFPVDSGPSPLVRRGIYLEGGEYPPVASLGLAAALRYLGGRDRPIEWSDSDQLGEATIIAFKGGDGAYRGEDDGGLQTLLTFPHKEYPQRDFGWAMECDLSDLREFVSGKIVLVGVSADSIKDSLPTPVSEGMRGLDLHAAFADQIIGAALGQGPATVRTFPDWTEMLSVIACALIGFGIGILSKRVILAGGLALVLSAAILFSGKLFLANYTWLPVVSPALAMLIGFGCAAMASWAVEKFALSQARGLMLALLGEEQIGLVWGEREQLLSSGKISAQPSYATIMMTDLKGYTAATEKLGRDGVLPWLNRYMDRMSQIVKEHDGFVKSYIGDAIYAVFGLGKSGDEASEPARQAILCALEMREALVALNKEYQQEDLPEAAMRVGLCSGDLSFGTMGSHGAMEYAIMGDTVNIAARLEAYDKDLAAGELCRTIVSCTTLELAGADGFESEEVGQLALKGKTNKIAAHRIISARTT